MNLQSRKQYSLAISIDVVQGRLSMRKSVSVSFNVGCFNHKYHQGVEMKDVYVLISPGLKSLFVNVI